MKAHVFSEGSNTTAEDETKSAKEYFQGQFRMISGLTDELSESTNTSLHVISEEFGLLRGDQPISDASDYDQNRSDDLWKSTQEELLTAASEADVMVILMSTGTFEKTVGEIWPQLVKEAKPNSIWCIGAARSALSSIDIEKLKQNGCWMISYQRVGVARISTDIREDLLEAVSQKSSK